MALDESQPIYVPPCTRERDHSLDSVWLSASDFGECCFQPLDNQFYPCLTPVYNGQDLKINPELIHASLSGISIKHYYGKCYKDPDEDEEPKEWESKEMYGYDLVSDREQSPSPSVQSYGGKGPSGAGDYELSTTASTENQDNSEADFTKPVCVRPKINFRNSFWNIHRPELCKLTWPQKYVSTATVTGHLHDHLTSHGILCETYHQEADRIKMLNKELDEYGSLKTLASPRDIPPDEKPFPFNAFLDKISPRCRQILQIKPIINNKDRFLKITEDEGSNFYTIHRSKEEFCLTIGKHVRKPTIEVPISEAEEYGAPESIYYYPQEAEEEHFAYTYNFLQYGGKEESSELQSSISDSESDEDTVNTIPIENAEPCLPIDMSDFCRAAGKADFSDLRCNPDDF